jgi:predicted nucleic acid-binding protein
VSGSTFVDSTVFIYAFDALEPRKQERARVLIEGAAAWVISPQVMLEFYWTVTRKARIGLGEREAESAVRSLATSFEVLAPDHELVFDAIALSRRDQVAIWDALIVQCALTARCTRLLTEDLQHGRRFGDLTIENPFQDLN